MPKIPSLEEMLKSGVHFGHKVSKWHPKMAPYIFGSKNGVHIINLEKTVLDLEKALEHLSKLASQGKVILFVGTKEQVREIIKKNALKCGMPYVDYHWVGGTFTNFSVVSKKIKKLEKLKDDKEKGKLDKYPKQERQKFDEEIIQLEEIVGGLVKLKNLPDTVFIVDLKRERTAVREAIKKSIPIIAIVDTNTNPEPVAYPIPANDDGIKSLEMIIGLVADAIKEGKVLAKEGVEDKS